MAEQGGGGAGGGEDLITIVDVTDPDEPSYADFKTRRRPLTAVQLASLRPMLQKVGAYQFFSRDLGFADAPAVKQFVDSVELEEFKPTKTYRIVQSQFKGTVAGREVVVNAELVEKTFGLVDDGENISKPRGDDVSGLHAFYIKPHHVEQCQNHRGVNLAHVRGEYSYFENMVHQIQTYCCGVPEDGFMKLTQYRALDMVVRGKPVNWNRYLLQNFQERVRKYRKSPCPVYFAGTLTALIYAALNVDYTMVNKMEQQHIVAAATPPPPPSPKRTPRTAAASSKKASSSSSTPRKGRKRTKSETETEKAETSPRPTRSSARRAAAAKTAKDGLDEGSAKRLKPTIETTMIELSDSEEVQEHTETEMQDLDKQLEAASSGLSRRQVLLLKENVDIPEVFIGGNKTSRLSTLFNQAIENPITRNSVPLTDSKDLWKKYTQYYSLGQECHLEHIISKRSLEESSRKVKELEQELEAKNQQLLERLEKLQELEDAVKDRDERLSALQDKVRSLGRNPEDLEIRFEKRSHAEQTGGAEDGVQACPREEPAEREEQRKADSEQTRAVSGDMNEAATVEEGDNGEKAGQDAAAEQAPEESKLPEKAVPTGSTMDLAANGAAAQQVTAEVGHREDANSPAEAAELGASEDAHSLLGKKVGASEDANSPNKAEGANSPGKAAEAGPPDTGKVAEVVVNHTAKAAEVGATDTAPEPGLQAKAEMELAKKDQLIAALMVRLEALQNRV